LSNPVTRCDVQHDAAVVPDLCSAVCCRTSSRASDASSLVVLESSASNGTPDSIVDPALRKLSAAAEEDAVRQQLREQAKANLTAFYNERAVTLDRRFANHRSHGSSDLSDVFGSGQMSAKAAAELLQAKDIPAAASQQATAGSDPWSTIWHLVNSHASKGGSSFHESDVFTGGQKDLSRFKSALLKRKQLQSPGSSIATAGSGSIAAPQASWLF
jgi:hypothetical protein